jgi:hypothetical protein
MNRLFCLGDSFVDWPIPQYHWTYYLSKHFEITKFGKAGADNYSILYQLGNLPEYEEGDRIVIVFTAPGRLIRRYYGDRHDKFLDNPYRAAFFYKDYNFAKKLETLSYIETEKWENGERQIEINFLKNLKKWLSKYNPIFVTWSDSFHTQTSDFVTLITSTSNWEEKWGEESDFHPGPSGCYHWYKEIHSLLDIKEPIVDFEIEDIKKTIL